MYSLINLPEESTPLVFHESEHQLPAMTGGIKQEIRAFERFIEERVDKSEQVDIPVHQQLHAGVYTRSSLLKAGVIGIGTEIKVPTNVLIYGHVILNVGDEPKEYRGFVAFKAEAGRKQVIQAVEDSLIVMSFATDAKTVEEAENEFTDEVDRLQTRRNK